MSGSPGGCKWVFRFCIFVQSNHPEAGTTASNSGIVFRRYGSCIIVAIVDSNSYHLSAVPQSDGCEPLLFRRSHRTAKLYCLSLGARLVGRQSGECHHLNCPAIPS